MAKKQNQNDLIDFTKIDKRMKEMLNKLDKNKKKSLKIKKISIVGFVVVCLMLLYSFQMIFNIVVVGTGSIKEIYQDKEILNDILKLYKNQQYTLNDFIKMFLGACVTWFAKSMIDDKEKQTIQKEHEFLLEQKQEKICPFCGQKIPSEFHSTKNSNVIS